MTPIPKERSAITLALVCLAQLAVVLGADPKDEKKPEEEALHAVRRYLQMFKEGNAVAAVETFWEMDVSGIFGDRLKQHTDDEKAEIRRLLLRGTQRRLTDNKWAEAMAKATYSDFKSEALEGGRVAVTFKIAHPEQTVPSRLILKLSGDEWRIVDAGRDSKRMMVPRLKELYRKFSQDMTPLAFTRVVFAAKK